jgi:hypothetical protein
MNTMLPRVGAVALPAILLTAATTEPIPRR